MKGKGFVILRNLLVCLVLATLAISEAPAEVVEFEDSFEVSEWNGFWVEDSQNDWFRSTQRATAGSHSAEVDGRATDATLTMANPIDLGGKGSATLTFSWFIESGWDRGEYIALDVFDGIWHEIKALQGNVDAENVWHHESVDLSDYMVSNFKIRFRAKVSLPWEDGNVDDVKIVSTISNNPPVADNQSVTTAEDTPVGITLTASDPDGDALTYSVVTPPSNGILSGTAPNPTYTPNPDFNGSDSFTFKANDGIVDSNVATVSITVTPVNDTPVAEDQSVITDEDMAMAIILTVSDVDGDTLTYSVVTNPSNGTLSGAAPNLTYTPNPNFYGGDSFTFKANDGTVDSNTATVSITVTTVNDAPIAADVVYGVDEDNTLIVDSISGVLANDSDVDGDSLTAILVSGTTDGTLTLNADGSFTYTPNANVNGSDSFTYTANDSAANSNVATVSITVIPVNDAPVADNQSVTSRQNTPVAITLAGIDVDGDTLTFSVVTPPANGSLSGTEPNLTYTPDTGFIGSDGFTFKANDGTTASNEATVSITVTENNPPVADNQSVTTAEDTPVDITLTASDADADPLTFSTVTNPSNGNLSGTPPLVTYTPNANFNGSDSFTFKVNDGKEDSNIATVSITVTAVNDAPVADAQSVTTDEDIPVDITLTASDVDGDILTFSIVAQPSNGSLSGTTPNLSYTPNANYNGSDSFTFKANDGVADSNIAIVSITINAVNDAPVADDQSVTTDEDIPVEITLTGSDVDGDSLTYSVVTAATNGSLSGTVPNLTYTPEPNFNGVDSFTFKANDGTADGNIATVSITVNPAEVVEFEDSFEVSEWNGLWVEDSQNDWFRSTQRATDGSRSAEVDGSATDATLTMANPIDLSGKEDATLTFSWFIEGSWDDGEYIALDVFDGSWHEIRVLRGNIDQENVWLHEVVNLSAYPVSDFKIRFRAKVSSSREDGNVDDVKIVSGVLPDTDVVSYPFGGIKWTHRSATSRRPLNINILEVDLNDAGISPFVTPGFPPLATCHEVEARKTTTFVSDFKLQVGINGDFSDPDCNFSRIPGEPTGVYGLGVSYREAIQGLPEIPRDQYSPHNNRPALTFTQAKVGYIGWYEEGTPFPPEVYNAVAGNKMLVEDGQSVDPYAWDPIGGALDLNPRTSVGLSSDGKKLIIIVIDGRQAGFSEGVTLPEMAGYLVEFGSYTGLNLDGGGSSTMVFGTPSGPDIINYPSDGEERVRANHLGIYAVPAVSAPTALARRQIRPKRNLPVYALLQNYPNPFNPETWIPFTLPEDAHVSIRIYNMRGQLMRTLDLGNKSAGLYVSRDKSGYWNGRNVVGEKVANGVYFCVMETANFRAVRKMVIMK